MPHVERLAASAGDDDAARLKADVERLLAERSPEIQVIARAVRPRLAARPA